MQEILIFVGCVVGYFVIVAITATIIEVSHFYEDDFQKWTASIFWVVAVPSLLLLVGTKGLHMFFLYSIRNLTGWKGGEGK
jgi:hypothetical protein